MLLYLRRCVLVALIAATCISYANGRAILGVDLGSLYMKVALVQSGSPLEIVTNLHSKRKTEQMILFDRQQRFYGADASSLLARKSQKTPAAMSLLLGRDDQHPAVRILAERHYPVRPVYNETRSGVQLVVDGIAFTPEELVAMVLSHAVDISVAHAASQGSNIAPPQDCVLTVPAYATDHERRALMDAAALAELNVLQLIDENTAAALHYAMDKNFEEKEELFLFYNMGASALQVSLVRFFNYQQPQKYGKPKSVPALEVLSKTWDNTLGGEAFDHLLVEYLAEQFNHAWHKATGKKDGDVRTVPRAMTKLRLQANKIKHVLSANVEIPVYMESVHDDIALSTHITRSQLEELAAPLMERAVQPVLDVLKHANKTMEDLTGTEILGGGVRIPCIQESLQKALGSIELGKHMNGDDSMALGAAFVGANISTAFRVRHVGLTDVNPFGITVTLNDMPGTEGELWQKQTSLFKSFGKLGVKKTIAFTHDRDIHCELDYDESDILPVGTERAIARYNVTGVSAFAQEMAEKGLGKPKVSLQFELGASGVTNLVKAEAAVEETYTVEEEVEVDDDEATSEGEAESQKEDSKEADKKTEENKDEGKNETEGEKKAENKTKEEKPKKKIKVQKEKKRVHKKALKVDAYFVGRVKPHSAELMAESKAKLLAMAMKDKERMMLEESKNKVESYIYRIKNTLSDKEDELAKISTSKQREEVQSLAEKAEEWLYDEGYSADLATMEDKYAELSVPFEKIMLRLSETTARPEVSEALRKKLVEVEELMGKWETSMPQVTEEERTKVLDLVEEARKWLDEKEKAQTKRKPHEDPAFLSSEVPAQLKPVEAMVLRLSRKPKPKPVKKNETMAENTTSTTANATTESNTTDSEANKTEDSIREEEL